MRARGVSVYCRQLELGGGDGWTDTDDWHRITCEQHVSADIYARIQPHSASSRLQSRQCPWPLSYLYMSWPIPPKNTKSSPTTFRRYYYAHCWLSKVRKMHRSEHTFARIVPNSSLRSRDMSWVTRNRVCYRGLSIVMAELRSLGVRFHSYSSHPKIIIILPTI